MDSMKQTKIYNTTNYDKFKLVLSNRPITEHHVKEIMSEIQRKDLTSENPIKVTRSHEIMEGQHTAEACKRLNMPIYYIYSKMTDDDIGKYNSVQKSWSYENVLNHFCVKGLGDYKILAGFRKRHPYPMSTLIILLTGQHTRRVMTEFRNGEFIITLPVAPVTLPVITSPIVNVPVELAIVNVGVTGVVPIAADSYTACKA